MRLNATINEDGSWFVLAEHGSRCCLSRPSEPSRKGDVKALVTTSILQATGTTQGLPHWYVDAFAVNALVSWVEIELARAERIRVDVKRSFTLEVG